jgi:SAM-dependent methyltransferase
MNRPAPVIELGPAEDLDVLDGAVSIDGCTVVDAGCGAGALSRHLASRGATVVALEPDPAQARINAGALAGVRGVTFHECGAEHMPCDDRSVDGVVFSKSLHHVPAGLMDRALGEALRVLRSGDSFLYALEPEIEGAFSDLMRPFHDETKARAEARQALARVARPAFAFAETIHYSNLRRFADFDAFVRSVCGATYNDVERGRVDTPGIRARFETGRQGEAYVFEQPMRVELFREPLRR